MRVFFDVSFPLAMPRDTLTYHFDRADDDPLPRPGCRVVATIQKRHVIGYIVSIHEQAPAFKTMPVVQIVDYWPLLSPALVGLGQWIAETCFCSPGEAFHAMLPGGIKQKIVRTIGPTPEAVQRKAAGEDLANALLWLIDHGQTPLNLFFRTFPNLSRKVGEWSAEGLVEIIHRRSEAAGPKVRTCVVLAQDKALNPDACTPKEKQVIEFLLKTNAPCTAADICRGAGVSSAPVQQLLRKKILTEKEDRVFREVATEAYYSAEPAPMPLLTADQEAALFAIRLAEAGNKRPVLVWGVTCSGKTEIYLRWVSEQLDKGQSAIVLVPEISLTPQMVKRFRDRFHRQVAILHSRLSDGERFDQWENIRLGKCRVVVGARSAVFAPVRNLGTIILDEEGEPTFKQGEAPRYHAREAAARRCELENALLVMGSATPTMEAFKNAQDGLYTLVRMPQRVSKRFPPQVRVVDMRRELIAKKNRSMFSGELARAVAETIAQGKQVILYLNRRGYSSFVFCRACGQAVECSRCGVSLVYHSGAGILRCHYCGEARNIPKECALCGSGAIKFFGAGTQRIEAEARRYFPKARIQRLDSDTVASSGSMEDILDRFGKREIDILIGTQMVAKGLDFPDVTLVGIMAADSLLRLPDFRAGERNFSLLAQVSGRSGRGDTPGQVVLQTYYPEHHSIKFALTEDYAGFYDEEAKHRQATGFPPFKQIAMIVLSGEQAEKARRIGDALREQIQAAEPLKDLVILGPAPAPIERINNQYRFQILLKGLSPGPATACLKALLSGFPASGVRVSIDVNPFFAL